jgi:hypothetical protein
MQALRVLVMGALCVLASGCVPQSEATIESAQPNPRFRPDGAPLDTSQVLDPDLDYGPYRIGDGELVSPVYPVPDAIGLDGRTANLIQSDCLWLGRDSQAGFGDRVAFSWEETWTFQLPPESPPLSADDRTLGMCTLSHPRSRQLLLASELGIDVLDSGMAQSDAGLYVATSALGLRYADEPEVLPGERLVLSCAGDYRRDDGSNGYGCRFDDTAIYGTRLTAHAAAVPDPLAHPDGACPSAPIGGTARVLGRDDLLQVTPIDDYLPLCMRRGSWRPERDSRLELSGHQVAPGYRTGIGPNLMVVDRSRSIRRGLRRSRLPALPPQPARENWTWQTPVRLSASGKARWQENFSAGVGVASARVRLRRGSVALSRPIDAELCLVGAGTQCTFRCRAQAEPSGALYTLDEQRCVDAAGRAAAPIVTPTYVFTQLDPQPGRPQASPLRWEIRGVGALPLASDIAELEFALVARGPSGAALRADHSGFDFSRVQAGSHSARMETLLRNDGDQAIRIERLAMTGAHPSDFTAQWPGAARPIPLPLELPASAQAGKPRFLRPTASLAALPMFSADNSQPDAIGIARTVLANSAFELYGAALRIEQGLLVARDPEFDFVDAARREAIALDPGLDPEASIIGGRPVVMFAQSLRQLPLQLAPGETARLSLTARPTALGERTAVVRIDWSPTLPGSTARPILLTARARSVSAAILAVLPEIVAFPAGQGAARWRRNLVVNNVGESAGSVRGFSVVGRDRAVFTVARAPATPLGLDPGVPVVIAVEARPPACAGGFAEYEAGLRIALDDGSSHDVPLRSLCMQ